MAAGRDGRRLLVGVDTGGTFTDLIAWDAESGDTIAVKRPSTPTDPSRAVVECAQELASHGIRGADVWAFLHGTTVATNALIERSNQRVGLLITQGTRAVYPARKSFQPPEREAASPYFAKPEPLIPQRRVQEVNERIGAGGEVLTAPDVNAVRAALREMVERHEIESIGVCLLFSFVNDAHERAIADMIRHDFPELRVSLSSALLPTIREYMRLSTTAVDAYVGPTVDRYLSSMIAGLEDAAAMTTARKLIMRSDGGLMNVAVARRRPVQTALSGPAAAVLAAQRIADMIDRRDVVALDIGGTSADIAVLTGLDMPYTTTGTIAGLDIGLPMVALTTIGAGGGSIAQVDKSGLLRVGPASAGADPGPACYGRGGTDPTVTDAAVALGYMRPVGSGTLSGLDERLARKALASISSVIGKPLEETALAILEVAASNMESELRISFVSRGFDPQRFSLVAMGGAGPLFGALLARRLGFREVVVPAHPALASTLGLLLADVKHTYLRTRIGRFVDLPTDDIHAVLRRLKDEATSEGRVLGIDAAPRLDFFAELRYSGQAYEIPVRIPTNGTGMRANVTRLVLEEFHRTHRELYGYDDVTADVEVVNFGLRSTLALPHIDANESWLRVRARRVAREARPVFIASEAGPEWQQVPVLNRSELSSASRGAVGPLIIEDGTSSVYVPPGMPVRGDANGFLRMPVNPVDR